jgi:hypothetical protein
MRITFDKIELKAKRVWKESGKKRQETRTFMQTVNPFNKNPDGSVKTRVEILKELHAERLAWLNSANGYLTVPSSDGGKHE